MEINISFEERKEVDGMYFEGSMERTMRTDFGSYEQTDDFISFMVKFFSRESRREITFDKYFRIIKGYGSMQVSVVIWNDTGRNSTDTRTMGEKLTKKEARSWVLYAVRRAQEEDMLSKIA